MHGSALSDAVVGTVLEVLPRSTTDLRVAGLFAGIGGIETGFERSGLHATLLVEKWEPAQAVLKARFDADLESDVQLLRGLPSDATVVSAGFPCQDLSQAGRTAGIAGRQSGLVSTVFRLLAGHRPVWLVLENVQFMLQLGRGKAMSFLVDELNSLGYRWAYRVVDSRFSGVPQRRRRVLLVASPSEDPRGVLFADDAGEPPSSRYVDSAFGFYWTEGVRGLGWAVDAVPTLKGGSTLGIPSPPGVWVPSAAPGRKLVKPAIEDLEQLQGFTSGWTRPAELAGFRPGIRHKLVGNAVTVGVAQWLGSRLVDPGAPVVDWEPMIDGNPWPSAAWGDRSGSWTVRASEYPEHRRYTHLVDAIELDDAPALTHKAVSGFWKRLQCSGLRRPSAFDMDVKEHINEVAIPALL